MRNDALAWLWSDEHFSYADGDAPLHSEGWLQPLAAEPHSPESGSVSAGAPAAGPEADEILPAADPPPEAPDLPDLAPAEDADGDTGPQGAGLADDIDPAQILRDRPDVFAAFYREFYGPSNDRNSPAWVDRVGGDTPEDYARYWYEAHGLNEGYVPGSAPNTAPAEGPSGAAQGRTTLDGVPIAKILADRPDVFQAFFTEYYGPNNDRHSDAWAERVGGTTVEDYAEYWYNAHGKLEGYRPTVASAPEAGRAPDPGPSSPRVEDPSLDPWNHPAIYPDWQPPYPGWRPPGDDATAGAPAEGSDSAGTPTETDVAVPLVIHLTADGVELLPASPGQIVEEGVVIGTRTLFDDGLI